MPGALLGLQHGPCRATAWHNESEPCTPVELLHGSADYACLTTYNATCVLLLRQRRQQAAESKQDKPW